MAAQPQAVQAPQDAPAAPAANQMMPELGNVVKASLSSEKDAPAAYQKMPEVGSVVNASLSSEEDAPAANQKMSEVGSVVNASLSSEEDAPVANQKMPEVENVVKASLSNEENADDGRGKGAALASQWHRVKWTGDMVMLLVSIVSYIDDDVDGDHGAGSGGRKRKQAMLKKKGKWRMVSSAMTERGHPVSPQQCEDKFNDLNKRYKRVTEILGRGTACKIVEKPVLLEQMNLSGNLKEEAKKYLSSKHLHYEQMCSYHNHNRQCLLKDPALQRSLRMALRSPDGQGNKHSLDDEDNQMLISDDDKEDNGFDDDLEVGAEDHRHHAVHGTKNLKHDHEGGTGGSAAQKNPTGMNATQVDRDCLKIKGDMLEIEHSHLEWLKVRKEEDMELQKMKLENERMKLENERTKLENERLQLQLKFKETEMGIKSNRI